MTTKLLHLENLSRSYPGPGGNHRAVDGVSLGLEAGEFVAIQGPSGCGKTTLILMAGALLQPTSGRVWLAGHDPYALSPERRAGFRAANVGFVFQQVHLIPYLSVLDNVLAATLAGPIPGAEARARELLAQFALESQAARLCADLSTGERQRTALARALLARPKLLLADEPTGNLDPENGDRVLRGLAQFAAGGGGVLLVTHDPRAADHARRIVRMDKGRIDGPADFSARPAELHEA